MASKNGSGTTLRMDDYRPEPMNYETVEGRTIPFKTRPEMSDVELLNASSTLRKQNQAQTLYNGAKHPKEKNRAERMFSEGIDGFLRIILPDITEAELQKTPDGEKTFIRDWWSARQPNSLAAVPSTQEEETQGEV